MVLWGSANVGGGREASLVSHLLWTLDFPISASYQYEVKGFTSVIIALFQCIHLDEPSNTKSDA